MKNILLFRLGSLGDLLVTFPSLYWLREQFPSWRITLVGRKKYGSLLEKTGVVDELLSVEDSRVHPLLSQSRGVRRGEREWMGKYSLIGGWFQSTNTAKIRYSPLLIHKEVFFLSYDPSQSESVSRFFFDKTVEYFEGRRPPYSSFIRFQRLPLNRRQSLLPSPSLPSSSPWVVVHPGSGSCRKCWPWDRFSRLIQDLDRCGIKGVLVTGPAEERLEEQVARSFLPSSWLWLRHPSLFSLASLLSQAGFYLGNDSGVTHLAGLCGSEGLALFLDEFQKEWRPLGNISVLSADSIDRIGYDSVRETLYNKLISHGGSATLNR